MSARELTPEAHKTIAEKMDELIAFAALYGVIVDVKLRFPGKPERRTRSATAKRVTTCAGCGGLPDHVACPNCGAPAGEACCAGDPDRCIEEFR